MFSLCNLCTRISSFKLQIFTEDGISNLLQELPPTLVDFMLLIFTRTIIKIFDSLAATETFLPPWPSSQHVYSATHILKLTATVSSVEWNSVVDCLIWIDDLVGSPRTTGLYKRTGRASESIHLVGSIAENILGPACMELDYTSPFLNA